MIELLRLVHWRFACSKLERWTRALVIALYVKSEFSKLLCFMWDLTRRHFLRLTPLRVECLIFTSRRWDDSNVLSERWQSCISFKFSTLEKLVWSNFLCAILTRFKPFAMITFLGHGYCKWIARWLPAPGNWSHLSEIITFFLRYSKFLRGKFANSAKDLKYRLKNVLFRMFLGVNLAFCV